MALQHIVLFKFTDDATPAQVKALSDGLSNLPETVPQIRSYQHGPDAGVSATSWDYALVAEFDSSDDFQAYREHPAHVAVVHDLVEPISPQRVSVQLRL